MLAKNLPGLARELGFTVEDHDTGHGFQVVIPGGFLSVIWHSGSYSDGRFGNPEESETVEVWNLENSTDVEGYVDAGYVASVLGKLAPNPEKIEG